MEIKISATHATAQEIQIGQMITLQEIKLTGSGIVYAMEPEPTLRIADLNATLIVTEASLNRLLADTPLKEMRDLQVETLTGRIRVKGRYLVAGRIPVPFAVTAVPEIEGGARLRLDPRQIHFVGAPLPAFAVNLITERINARLAQGFDVNRLPVPLRLTALTVEPGRFLIAAAASLQLRLDEFGSASRPSPGSLTIIEAQKSVEALPDGAS
jgi:hypothetical protein